MISVTALEVSYSGSPVVEDVAFEVGAGEWLGLIGPNGAGKSSLLGALAGTTPHRGEVMLSGRRIEDMSRRDIARAVAVVPQSPVLPDGLSVIDYVLLGRTPYLGYFAAESSSDIAATEHVLWDLGLIHLADRPLASLSGGERQRTVLARALAQSAPALLLDEPTSALDIGHGQQVLDLVDQLRRSRGLAVVSAMHDLTLVAQYAERVVLMLDGRMVAEGPPADVFTAESLLAFSGARVTIMRGPGGEPVIVPIRETR